MTAVELERTARREDAEQLPLPPAPRSRVARMWRGRPDDPVWVRPALLGLLAATAVLYLWGLEASGYANSFYAAAVQAGTKSWKAMFFGSFDSSNFITVDKSPAALWVMELSARIFGFSTWSMLAPQALEGVAAVGVLYLTVRRWFPPAAALVAGLVAALTPVAALMFRFNNPDALMVLFLTLAAYATVRGVEDGRTRWIVLAGTFVGCGFLAKMLQALLVAPAIGLVYLVAAPGRPSRRVRHLLYGGLAIALSAGWWIAAVQLTPAADRPYIGGSQNNSLWNLIFGYNGFGRLTGSETGSVGGGGAGGAGNWGPTGLGRLFGTSMGSQISWLLPAALILLAVGLYVTRRAPRRNRGRAAFLLWGGTLAVTGLAFSLGRGIIHPYYTVALAPAIGALVGIGGYIMWAQRHTWIARAVLGACIAVTAGWSVALLDRTPHWLPWLRVTVAIAGAAGAAGVLAWPWLRSGLRPAVAAALSAALAAAVVVAGLGGPLAYTLDTVNTPHTGAIPTAGPSGGSSGGLGGPGPRAGGSAPPAGATPRNFGATGALPAGAFPAGAFPGGANPGGAFPGSSQSAGTGPGGSAGGLLNASRPSAALTALLDQNASSYQWVAATVGANEAAGYQLATGHAVMAIGGFNGTDPYPTLARFESLVRAGKVHYFIAGGGFGGTGLGGGPGAGTSSASSAVTAWVEANFSSKTVGGVTVYDLSSASNG